MRCSAEDWSGIFCLLYNFVSVSCDKLLLNELHRKSSRRDLLAISLLCTKPVRKNYFPNFRRKANLYYVILSPI
jgi:hypothetical protein